MVKPWKCEEGQSICCNPRMKESYFLRCPLPSPDLRVHWPRRCPGVLEDKSCTVASIEG